MIALHACDIATDYAIHSGIRSDATIIMCSPCCHKQIRLQMQSPALPKPMLNTVCIWPAGGNGHRLFACVIPRSQRL